MQTIAGNEFMVGFGEGSIGLAVNPPPTQDGAAPIDYMDMTPDEAESLANLLIENARMARATIAAAQH
jgi:hypothetical protein